MSNKYINQTNLTVFETEIEHEKDLLARIYHVKWMAAQYKLLFPGIRILEKFKISGWGGGELVLHQKELGLFNFFLQLNNIKTQH